MASNNSSQKFIGKNRAPRVQVEYDVELYGAEKKVNLPFVMGVMADLSGKSEVTKDQRVEDKKFLDIDADNFDDRMKSIKPRVAFNVPNVMTGEGNLAVDVSFESIQALYYLYITSTLQYALFKDEVYLDVEVNSIYNMCLEVFEAEDRKKIVQKCED